MKYISVCSGIEAATVAWHGLGWKAAAYSEIEAFPSAVLAHHYPDIPNVGDMTKFKEWNIEPGTIDLLVGGTPCQSFSVAGLRKGLADPRGNLALVYCGILDHFKPHWFVWENVPGVLSSSGGRDFGSFLGAVAELGYGFAYRVLDAQFFGVAQRRRRVFVVGYFGDWRPAAKVLFERESLRGDTAPSREKGKVSAASPTRGAPDGGETVGTLMARDYKGIGNQDLTDGRGLVLEPHEATFVSQPVYEMHGQDSRVRDLGETCSTVTSKWGTGGGNVPVTFQPIALQDITAREKAQNGRGWNDDGTAYTVDTAATQGVMQPVNIYGGNKRADRPDGGFYVRMNEETSKTLDAASGLNPTCSQGGTAVLAPTLTASNDPSRSPQSSEITAQVAAVAQATAGEALYNQGFNHESTYASTQETNAGKILRTLRKAVGEEAFAKWGLGILCSLQSSEILRQTLHGIGIRPATFSRNWVVYCTLSRQKDGSGWLLQSLRETECEGCPPQGWQLSEQFAGELGAYLSELSQPGAQAGRFMRDLWWAAQGAGLLRQALSAIQEMGRPANGQGQPTHGVMQVRRLTVEECEFLQGFPRGYTAIPWRGKAETPDGPRYKALGNSMAVPVMAWIGKRIQQFEAGNAS